MLRLFVEAVAFDHRQNKVVLLRDMEGQKVLPIWIGPGEARSIALELEGALPSRPLSHDLMLTTIHLAQGSVMRVVICDLQDDTFYATIELDTPQGLLLIDSRPSDAIALAVRARCPIFAADNVLGALVDRDEIVASENENEAQENNEESVSLPPAPPFSAAPPPEGDDEISRFRRLVGDLDI